MKISFAYGLVFLCFVYVGCVVRSDETEKINISGRIYQIGNDSTLGGIHVEVGYYSECIICDYGETIFIEGASTLTDSNGYYKINLSIYGRDTNEDWFIKVYDDKFDPKYQAQTDLIGFGKTYKEFHLQKL